MKAVIHSRHGNPEVLQVTTLERPVPQNNEVLIRVRAAGLDCGQWHLMAGKPYAVRLATGPTKPKQRVLGMDVSGVVDAVDTEVTRFVVGDALFAAASRSSPVRVKTSSASSPRATRPRAVIDPGRSGFSGASPRSVRWPCCCWSAARQWWWPRWRSSSAYRCCAGA